MNDLDLDRIRTVGMRLLGATMILLALGTLAGGFATGREGMLTLTLVALALPAWPLALAMRGATDATARLIVTMTVVAQPALMLYAFQGDAWQVDLHMIFFAVLAMTAILCDWRALVAGAGVVAVHHLLLGMALPDWVFLNGGGLPRILLHAVVLIAETGALVLMVRQIVALLDAVAVKEAERLAVEAQAADERARHQAELDQVLATLNTRLERLADGDLSQTITESFPQAYRGLRTHFNAALESLRDLVTSVAQRSAAIREASAEIAASTDQVARRAESAAASLEQTSAATDQMNGRLRDTASAAGNTMARAEEAALAVNDGRAVANDVVAAMARVSESAQGIDDVISGLDKIAFQTRVLAMNAAVEAGRAGEAGRGFAVVADLVAALAMRAEEEARSARDQLTTTQDQVQTAVAAVQRVDGALQRIATDVDDVATLMRGIADANAEQSEAIAQVTQAVHAMDRSTQENAATVEETSAATQSLSAQIDGLAQAAAVFRLDAAAPSARPLQRVAGASLH